MSEAIVVYDENRAVTLVITHTDGRIGAHYRPDAYGSKMQAESIQDLASGLDSVQLAAIFSDMTDSFVRAYPYGGYGQLMKYSGSDRKQIDTIVKKLKKA